MRYTSVVKDCIHINCSNGLFQRPTESSEEPTTAPPEKVMRVKGSRWEVEECSFDAFLEDPRPRDPILICSISIAHLSALRKRLQLHTAFVAHCAESAFTSIDSYLATDSQCLCTVTYLSDDLTTPIVMKAVLGPEQCVIVAPTVPDLVLRLLKEREEMEDVGELSEGVRLLFMLLTAIARNINRFVSALWAESEEITRFSLFLSASERVEFVQRINNAKKHLYLAQEVVTPKGQFLQDLSTCPFLPQSLSLRLSALIEQFRFMHERLKKCEQTIALAETSYLETVLLARTTYLEEFHRLLNNLAKIEIIFLPMRLLGNYLGTNVTVPYMQSGSLKPFGVILVLMFLAGAVTTVLLR